MYICILRRRTVPLGGRGLVLLKRDQVKGLMSNPFALRGALSSQLIIIYFDCNHHFNDLSAKIYSYLIDKHRLVYYSQRRVMVIQQIFIIHSNNSSSYFSPVISRVNNNIISRLCNVVSFPLGKSTHNSFLFVVLRTYRDIREHLPYINKGTDISTIVISLQ